MSRETTQDKPGMSLWLRVIFALSLALNLLVVGAVVGSYLKWGGHKGGAHSRLEQIGGPVSQALTPAQRREIGREMRQMMRKARAEGGAHRDIMQALVQDMRATPFDSAAVSTHLARQRGFVSDRMARGQALLLARLEQMSAQERAEFADRLEKALKRRPRMSE